MTSTKSLWGGINCTVARDPDSRGPFLVSLDGAFGEMILDIGEVLISKGQLTMALGTMNAIGQLRMMGLICKTASELLEAQEEERDQ